jgi:iron complex transport system ATP-binding protein
LDSNNLPIICAGVIAHDSKGEKGHRAHAVSIVPGLRVSLVSTDVHIEAIESAKADEPCDEILARLYHTSTTTTTREEDDSSEFSQALQLFANKLNAPHVIHRPFLTLSQGEQRLALVTGALASRPQLLVLDEASHALDNVNRNLLKQTLQDAVSQHPSLTTIVVSHHLDEFLDATTHDVRIAEGTVTVSPRV